MPEDKPEIEKTEPRVIELNEWFKPFEDYESMPYDVSTETRRQKAIPFQVANVGNFEILLNWNQEINVRSHEALEKGAPSAAYFKELMILPYGEEEVHSGLTYTQQRKLETRLMRLYVYKKGKAE